MVFGSREIAIAITIGSFILGMSGAWFMSRYAFKLGLVDRPNERSSHEVPTPRCGGIGILAVFILSSVVLHISITFWIAAGFLSIISFFDDSLGLSPKARLVFQFLAASAVLVSFNYKVEPLFILIPMVVFFAIFIVGTANFYNFMDGINGIAGLTGVAGFALIAFFSSILEEDNILILSLCISASCLGFLPFNMPKAKVFMGDVGSILLGFVFAALVVKLSYDVSSFLCLAFFLSLFYADALSTLFIRWLNGEKLSRAHRSHLYQLLANEFSLPHWKISISYGFLQLIAGVMMIWAWQIGLYAQLGLILLFSAAFMSVSLLVRRSASELAKT